MTADVFGREVREVLHEESVALEIDRQQHLEEGQSSLTPSSKRLALLEIPLSVRESIALPGESEDVLRKRMADADAAQRNLYSEVVHAIGPKRQLVERLCYYVALLDPELGAKCVKNWLERDTIPVPPDQALASIANEDTLRLQEEARVQRQKEEEELQARVLAEWKIEQEKKRREWQEQREADRQLRAMQKRAQEQKDEEERQRQRQEEQRRLKLEEDIRNAESAALSALQATSTSSVPDVSSVREENALDNSTPPKVIAPIDEAPAYEKLSIAENLSRIFGDLPSSEVEPAKELGKSPDMDSNEDDGSNALADGSTSSSRTELSTRPSTSYDAVDVPIDNSVFT